MKRPPAIFFSTIAYGDCNNKKASGLNGSIRKFMGSVENVTF